MQLQQRARHSQQQGCSASERVGKHDVLPSNLAMTLKPGSWRSPTHRAQQSFKGWLCITKVSIKRTVKEPSLFQTGGTKIYKQLILKRFIYI